MIAQFVQQTQQLVQLRIIQTLHHAGNSFPVSRQLFRQQGAASFGNRNHRLASILGMIRTGDITVFVQRSEQEADIGFGYTDSLCEQRR